MSHSTHQLTYTLSTQDPGASAYLGFAMGTLPDDAQRTGFYADLTAAAELLAIVVGGQAGPIYRRGGSSVSEQLGVGSLAALALVFGAAPDATNRTGLFADLTAGSEFLEAVAGGKAGPAWTRIGNFVQTLHRGRNLLPVVQLTDAATIAVDASAGDIFAVELGGNRTLGTPTNPPAAGQSQKIVIQVRQDATGSRTLAYSAAYRFGADVPEPTLSTGAGDVDYLGFIYDPVDEVWDAVATALTYPS